MKSILRSGTAENVTGRSARHVKLSISVLARCACRLESTWLTWLISGKLCRLRTVMCRLPTVRRQKKRPSGFQHHQSCQLFEQLISFRHASQVKKNVCFFVFRNAMKSFIWCQRRQYISVYSCVEVNQQHHRQRPHTARWFVDQQLECLSIGS